MEKQINIQIQSLLFEDNISRVNKVLENLANAREKYNQSNDSFLNLSLVFADNKEKPCLPEPDVCALIKKHSQSITISFSYFNSNTEIAEIYNRLSFASEADYLMIFNPELLVSGDFFINMLYPFSISGTALTEARVSPCEYVKEYDPKTLEAKVTEGECFIVRREIFALVGGFDERAELIYHKYIDLSWQIRNIGKKLIYCPNAPVFAPILMDNTGKLNRKHVNSRYALEGELALLYKWGLSSELRLAMSRLKKGTQAEKEVYRSFKEKMLSGELKKQSSLLIKPEPQRPNSV